MSIAKTGLTAKDVMTADPVCVPPSAGIRELARVFEENEVSGAPVIDQQGKLIGVVSKTDLIRRCSQGFGDVPPAYLFEILSEQGDSEEWSEVIPEPLVCVQDFMTEGPVTVGPDTLAAAIAKRMSEHGIHRVVVVDEGEFPIGIVTSLDMLKRWPG